MKKRIKMKRMNTQLLGDVIVVWSIIYIIIAFVGGLVLIPKLESLVSFGFMLLFIILVISFFKKKMWNHIYFTDKDIIYRGKILSWNEAYITFYCEAPWSGERGCRCYLHFSDKYLSEKEIKTNKICICLTPKRLSFLLDHCTKKIMIANKVAYSPRNEKYLESINFYNDKIHK